MSSAAKTVSFSPLRRGYVSLKNTLDTPFKLKWPDVSPNAASLILQEFERSLLGMRGKFARNQPSLKQKRKKRKKFRKRRPKRAATIKEDSHDTQEPPQKKICLETVASKKNSSTPSSLQDDKTSSNTKISDLQEQTQSDLSDKKSQMVVGVNSVTRSLERGELGAGFVCLSAKPALVTRHIMMLAATRGVPFTALPNLSQKCVELLGGIKSALAVGFKKSASSHFSTLIETISKNAPPIVVPWLSTVEDTSKSTQEQEIMDTKLVQTQSDTEELSSNRDAGEIVGSDGGATFQDKESKSIITGKESESSFVKIEEQISSFDNSLGLSVDPGDIGDSGRTDERSLYTPVQVKRTIVTNKRKSKKK